MIATYTYLVEEELGNFATFAIAQRQQRRSELSLRCRGGVRTLRTWSEAAGAVTISLMGCALSNDCRSIIKQGF